jgi:hypothetical protein
VLPLVAGVVVVALLFAVAPSLAAPTGVPGAETTSAPAERVKAIDATRAWLGAEAGGWAIQFHEVTWAKLETTTPQHAPTTSLYSAFNGVILVGHWPFVLPYAGSISNSFADGDRAETHIDRLAGANQDPAKLTTADRERIVAVTASLLAASDVGSTFTREQIAGALAITRDAGGRLSASIGLPPQARRRTPGELRVGFSRGLVPIYSTVLSSKVGP